MAFGNHFCELKDSDLVLGSEVRSLTIGNENIRLQFDSAIVYVSLAGNSRGLSDPIEFQGPMPLLTAIARVY